jgi:hypothetical protein
VSAPIVPLPISFARLNPSALETDTVFTTLAAAKAYASGPTAVVSQVISVVDKSAAVPIAKYEIQRDKSLKLIYNDSELDWIGDTDIKLIPLRAGVVHINNHGTLYADLPGGVRVKCGPDEMSEELIKAILTANGF